MAYHMSARIFCRSKWFSRQQYEM